MPGTDVVDAPKPPAREERRKEQLLVLSIKLRQSTRAKIYREVTRRKEHRLPNRTVQAVVEEALAKWFEDRAQ